MTDAPAVPPEFVSYVERRLMLLEGAALRLTGQEAHADRLSREMLALVAMRWRRLQRADARQGLEPSASADAYLAKLFLQEAEELSSPHLELRFDGSSGLKRRGSAVPRMRLADEAESIWAQARHTIRRRWILAAVGAGAVGLLALCQSRDNPEADEGDPEPAAATQLPTNTDRAPGSVATQSTLGKLPAQMALPIEQIGKLSEHPVTRAIALVTLSRSDTSPVYVLGDDGAWRQVDNAPEFAGLWLHAGSLAPNGTRAAFGTNSNTVVVDLRTGVAQEFPPARPSNRPVWLTSEHLILAKDVMIDLRSGNKSGVPVGPEDVLMPQNPPGSLPEPLVRLSQMLSVGDPATAPARTQLWVSPVTGGLISVTNQLRGPIGQLIGPWSGQGFASGNGLVVRGCAPAPVPSLAGAAFVVAVARLETGDLVRAIVTERPSGIRVLGWADSRHALLGLVTTRQQQIVSWDVFDGSLAVVSTINSSGPVSLPDLTWVA